MTGLGFVIGNSRLRWGYFQNRILRKRWATPHLREDLSELPVDLVNYLSANLFLYGASVVPSQTELLSRLIQPQWITLESVGLKNLYPTLGIDRALAVLGAGEKYGFPCLVIDGGTALTFTGVDSHRTLIGGAILGGLKVQLQSLFQQTASLPEIILPAQLPSRWANTTEEAIASGILYSVLAAMADFIIDWWRQFPDSRVILTGGDGEALHRFFKLRFPDWREGVEIDVDLGLLGLGSFFA